jgi:hypothetical protein
MRVLHLDSGRTLQGGQLQVSRLIEGLERLRVDQIVLARGELQRKVGAGPFDLATVFAQAGRADVIHAHDAQSHTWAALLGRGRPVAVSRRVAFPVKSGRAAWPRFVSPTVTACCRLRCTVRVRRVRR